MSRLDGKMLAGNPSIEIQVKQSKTLMHLKAYVVDDAVLQAGSVNWSPTELKRQDKQCEVYAQWAAVRPFEHEFDEMWSRLGNQVMQ